VFFGVRNIKKGDYFAKKIHKLFGKFWFTNKKRCDILQNGNFILLSFGKNKVANETLKNYIGMK